MILGFMQKFPWKGEDKQPVPTHFREKILAGVNRIPVRFYGKRDSVGMLYYPPDFQQKIHTMLTDPHNRWKPGMSIQMVYRGPKYSILDHFNKRIPELERCVSVQKIEIKFGLIESSHDDLRYVQIKIDDEMYWSGLLLSGSVINNAENPDSKNRITALAHNDGFGSPDQFFKWFKDNWSGKILHWTDFRY